MHLQRLKFHTLLYFRKPKKATTGGGEKIEELEAKIAVLKGEGDNKKA
jgi:hypothetical protein